MAKKVFRANKKAAKGKQGKWKKGQSSSYNPTVTKHRDEVKNRTKFGRRVSNSKLTSAALAEHDNRQDETSSQMGESAMDATSEGGWTFATAFTNCTNPTFDRLVSNFEQTSSLHQERLAVLAAVTEVIKSKSGSESNTEYFAALMTSLEVAEKDVTKTAVLTLLYAVLKKLSQDVVRKNFSVACPVLKNLLITYADSDQTCFLRNLVCCISLFLRAQDALNWTESVSDCYSVILQFTVHNKPKVRKPAQEAIFKLLNAYTFSEKSNSLSHPAFAVTAKFCVKQLETCSGSDVTTVCHLLNLMKNVLHFFPKAHLKLCCETVLRFMTLNNPVVVATCLGVINNMFKRNPLHENLPSSLNVKLLQALYEYQPNLNDSETLIAWLFAMESGFIHLFRLDPAMCLQHLPNFFKVTVACFLSEGLPVHDAVRSVLQNILKTCLDSSKPEFQQLLAANPIDNPMSKVFQHIESTLSYRFHQAWKHALAVLATCFDVMGKHLHPVMMKCLQSMADFRNTVQFPHIVELEKAFGIAIHRMGPEVVLKAVPLMIDPRSNILDFPRSWMLPLLRDNVKETKLGFFIRYFMPLVSRFGQKVAECEKENRVVEAKTYNVICSQIWSLLPAFCTSPTDLKESWKSIAKVLGMTLSEQPSLRMLILSSLRVLISKNKENENINEIARFSKNYLPILFNLYTTESKEKTEEMGRLAVYETIKAFLEISDHELCKMFLMKALEKLKDADAFTSQALLDICKAIIPYVEDMGLLQQLYDLCKPLLQGSNHTMQKKSYGILRVLCSRPSHSCSAFLEKNIEDFKSLLLSSQSQCSPPAKALRLTCLLHLVEHLPPSDEEFVTAIVPEATLGTKETGSKARDAAFQLLSGIGNTLLKWQPGKESDAFRGYLKLLYAGFVGAPHMINATVLALGHVAYNFKDYLDFNVMSMLVENMCLLLTSKSREVVAAALSFLKSMLSFSKQEAIAPHVVSLVKGLSSINEDTRRALRFNARELLIKLMRKFDYETLKRITGPDMMKQLIHIRKMEARKAKKKMKPAVGKVSAKAKKLKSDEIDDILEDSGDDGEDEVEQHESKAWIEERPTEIVDLMDPSANKKVLATKPSQAKKMKVKNSEEFEVAKDGRIVIPDEKEIPKNKKGSETTTQDINSSVSNKRKHDDMSDDEEDEAVKPKMKEVHRGIYRVSKKQKVPGEEFKAKKAGGDTKRGKIQPYSYIPLNKEMLNKRKKMKSVGQFKGIVRKKDRKSLKK